MTTTDEQTQTILRALRERRSQGKVKQEMPPREVIARVIEAAGWAPNHYHTEPWRFFVVAGEERTRLGSVMAEAFAARLENPDDPECRQLIEKERRKPLRAPVVIVVAVMPPENPKAVEVEEIAATAAAVQNMLLAAEALGLGAMWRTGAPAREPAVKRFFGLPDGAHILAFVYLGYPEPLPMAERERDALRRTVWLGWTED